MKKILLIFMSCFLSTTIYSQTNNSFKYELLKNSKTYRVYPVIDQSKGAGKRGYASISPDYCFNTLLNSIIKEELSKEKIESLSVRSQIIITLNSSGEIFTCRFLLNGGDRDVISEKELNNLYSRFIKVKLDMSKIEIKGPNSEKYDISDIAFTFKIKDCNDVQK